MAIGGQIDIKLSEEGLNKAIREVESKRDGLVSLVEAYMSALLGEGVLYAKSEAPVDTSALQMSIGSEMLTEGSQVKGAVYASSGHAAFVEFGTGIVGEGTYPGDTAGYQYNLPSPFKDESGGWTWRGKYGRIYTHGYSANPFMYRTTQHLINVAEPMAEVIPK